MEVLWQDSPLTSSDVVERMSGEGLNEKTVKTYLNRLVKKQVLSFEKDGRRYLYSPLVQRNAFLAEESNGFLSKVFRGDMRELLATFVNNKQLSKHELEYLEQLLNDESGDQS